MECLRALGAALLAQLLAQLLQQALLLGREAARQAHIHGDVLVALGAALAQHRQALPAHAQPVARLRARPDAHLLVPVQRRHPAVSPHMLTHARLGACVAHSCVPWIGHRQLLHGLHTWASSFIASPSRPQLDEWRPQGMQPCTQQALHHDRPTHRSPNLPI